MGATTAFRTLTAADLPAAAELNRLAGWNQTESDWAGYLRLEPEGCQGAEIGGRLAGTFTALRHGSGLGWIGMVLVHPEHRRKGLGTALLRRAIAHLRDRGVRSIGLDATPAGRAVYLPLGFRDRYRVTRFEGAAGEIAAKLDQPDGAPGPIDPEAPIPAAFRDVKPFGAVPFGAVRDLDTTVFGADRSAILGSLSQREPRLCKAVHRGPEVAGYLIARTGREAVQVGPWAAPGVTVASALLRSVLAAAQGSESDPRRRAAASGRIFIDLPAPNVAGERWLREIGFGVQRSFTRMFLGELPPPGRPDLVYSTSGPEKG